MGLVLLNWTYFSDMILCPDFIANDIQNYQMKFDRWISDKSSNHAYWVKISEGEMSLCFGSDAFINWLNLNVLADFEEKVVLVRKEFLPSKKERQYPHINF